MPDPTAIHTPPCASWEAHVETAYADIRDGDDYDLMAFADFLMHTWDNERLAADPEFPFGSAAEWDNHPRFNAKDRVA